MKPLSSYKGTRKNILIVFSIIPISLIALSATSYFTNPFITMKHLIIFTEFIFLFSALLLVVALMISNYRLDIYEDRFIIVQGFSKKEIFLESVLKIEMGQKGNKFASTDASCFVFRMLEDEEIKVPVRPFESDKDEIYTKIRKISKNNRQQKNNSK